MSTKNLFFIFSFLQFAVVLYVNAMDNTSNQAPMIVGEKLILACKTNDEQLAKNLLDTNETLVNFKSTNGDNTPLHWACQRGYVEIIKQLISYGANIEVKNRHNETPLHWASSAGHKAAIQELVNSGATIDAQTINGSTATSILANRDSMYLLAKELINTEGANLRMLENRPVICKGFMIKYNT